ncbi:DUF4105 domain-containing protein [Hymenobacter sp. DG01]|uniref:lipoprotein N-acyltransferase Lnb domain-containing protein n=1 Tax=Hymenobacter sp. DG01 TaxID=2584940 RepID=UPI0011220EB3|nr:DUF4105 domain-containing protein [Hymenobacter sp. DG01]
MIFPWLPFCRMLLIGSILQWGVIAPCFATSARLSSSASVSLLTCAPGSETYALFGHSALRITDPLLGLDQVYNYGTFDFQTTHFYWRFLRADLRYSLSAVPFRSFCQGYKQEGRGVQEHLLTLTPAEVQRVYVCLETTLHSPARYYQYQFFADNCSTRLFALLENNLATPWHLDSSRLATTATYRQLLAPYLTAAPWVKLGMNVGLGLPTDQPTVFRQRLFLPLELQQALAWATRQGRPLVAQQRQLLQSSPSPAQPVGISPIILLLSWTGASLVIWRWPSCPTWLSRLNRRVLFGVVGLLGCLLTGLSLGSLHVPVHTNYQVLWLLPSHLVLALSSTRPWWRYYRAGSLALLLLGGVLATALRYWLLLPEMALLLALLMGHLLLLPLTKPVTGN